MSLRSLVGTATLTVAMVSAAWVSAAWAQEDYGRWPLLRDPFPSTGGGGVMIGGYDPVVADGKCRTAFTATLPDGTVYRNTVEFDAEPAQGGILCSNGRWRSADGAATGTTPFRVFIRDGFRRMAPAE
ncbi:MAG: hypothetical protein JNK84_21385 [Phreatobacter sp.]|uniref:hypothetical protein n=1 Tax=Phreatobacter sp. TaxID=1966341 RepID=UPI001A4FDDA3|nr:hypothetical protein [Phreatobacter sp.]MBL8571636.1 hypothetical protein [Phreatobacter sp.]